MFNNAYIFQEVELSVEVLFLLLPFSSLYNLILHKCEKIMCMLQSFVYMHYCTVPDKTNASCPRAVLILKLPNQCQGNIWMWFMYDSTDSKVMWLELKGVRGVR